MMSVQDCIVSFVDGRVRLRHAALRDAAAAELVCSVLRGVDGVSSVSANPRTGSLLLFYDPERLSREQLLELTAQAAEYLPDEQSEAVESPAFASNIIEGAEQEGAAQAGEGKSAERRKDEADADNCDIGAIGRLAVVNALSGYAKLARLIERGGECGKGRAGSGQGGCQKRMGGGKSVGTALGLLSGVLSTALPGKFSKAVIGGAATVLPTVAKALSRGLPAEGEAEGGDPQESRQGAPLTAGDVAKLLTSRRVNVVVNRSMLAALGLSLAALPLRRSFLHAAAGGVFAAGVVQHLIAHRKSL